MSLAAQSQTITRKELLTDSVVVIPKTIARWMLQDVIMSKSYEDELKVMYLNADKMGKVIEKQDSIIDIMRMQNIEMGNTLDKCDELVDLQKNKILFLNKDLKKRSRHVRLWRAMTITATVGILANHLHWKYVKP